jgi:glutamine phosphoribosylpyrophosphate amidotransferase
MARYEMGRALAREHPADADVVMAIPTARSRAASDMPPRAACRTSRV